MMLSPVNQTQKGTQCLTPPPWDPATGKPEGQEVEERLPGAGQRGQLLSEGHGVCAGDSGEALDVGSADRHMALGMYLMPLNCVLTGG